jgi:hypothetical protein
MPTIYSISNVCYFYNDNAYVEPDWTGYGGGGNTLPTYSPTVQLLQNTYS